LVSRTSTEVLADGPSRQPSLSGDGRYVGFSSLALNLASGTHGAPEDVFVRAFPRPVVEAASPSVVARGTTTRLTITGTGFRAPTQVNVGGPQDLSFGEPTVVISSPPFAPSVVTLQVDVTVSGGAVTGQRDLVILNRGTGAGTLTGASTICTCLLVT
jgi:hypothetical protein